MDIKVIAFDADDTLWVNEPYFQETEKNSVLCWKIIYPSTQPPKNCLKPRSITSLYMVMASRVLC